MQPCFVLAADSRTRRRKQYYYYCYHYCYYYLLLGTTATYAQLDTHGWGNNPSLGWIWMDGCYGLRLVEPSAFWRTRETMFGVELSIPSYSVLLQSCCAPSVLQLYSILYRCCPDNAHHMMYSLLPPSLPYHCCAISQPTSVAPSTKARLTAFETSQIARCSLSGIGFFCISPLFSIFFSLSYISLFLFT